MNAEKLVIMHVEDDPALVRMVRIAFQSFGFLGEMISAESVQGAKDLLASRKNGQRPFSLIITDMKLPDGTGLDVVSEVRTNPVWKLTPVIVLSGETNEATVNSAYALGANCYLPKLPRLKDPLGALRNLYQCWMENARLPRAGSVDRVHATLERAIELRSHTSEFYLGLAGAFRNDPDEMRFWLNCALNEGNLSNLVMFFRDKLDGSAIDAATLDRLEAMQVRIKELLRKAEAQFHEAAAPHPATACQWALALTDDMDEDVFAEVLGALFPVSPVATQALKMRAAMQFQAFAEHVLARVEEPELRRKAGSLSDWAQRLMAGGAGCAGRFPVSAAKPQGGRTS